MYDPDIFAGMIESYQIKNDFDTLQDLNYWKYDINKKNKNKFNFE
jgi:hypothetical protein